MCVSGVFLLLITGGIHIDGYMDTMDAVHSYGNREKKLEILKDSHIGAFAVIMLAIYVLAAAGAFSYIFENKNTDIFIIMGCVFYLSRISSAFAAVNFKSARNGGMLNSVVRSVSGNVVNIMILLNYIICIAIMTYVNAFAAALCLIVQAAVLVYYRIWSYKIFGGVTGDLAGWFLCMSELCCMIVLVFV
jgi:adenosylcobinamide-GDP ribazoletransferase